MYETKYFLLKEWDNVQIGKTTIFLLKTSPLFNSDDELPKTKKLRFFVKARMKALRNSC
jgi:hypothetical protein